MRPTLAAPVPRRVARLGVGLTLVLAVVLGMTVPALAHPLGNSSTNLSSGLRVEPDRVVVDHVVDLAELRTVQLLSEADRDGDGSLGPTEGEEYAAEVCREVSTAATLAVSGKPVPLSPGESSLRLAPGQGGLQVARLGCTLTAPLRLSGVTQVEYRDGSYAGRHGWREVTAVGDGTTLVSSDVGVESPSARLTDYPSGVLPDMRTASLMVRAGGPRLDAAPAALGLPTGVLPRGVDGITASFLDLVGQRELTLGFGLLAVLLAVVLGSGHAVAPGHGKTVMAAYLVGQEGTPRQALVLGGIVTFTHTAGVLALGVLVLVSTTLAPERLLPLLEVTSGLLLTGVGLFLLRRAVARRRTLAQSARGLALGHHDHGDHHHDHDHGGDHSHGHHHSAAHAHGDDHQQHEPDERRGHTHEHTQEERRHRGLLGSAAARATTPAAVGLAVPLPVGGGTTWLTRDRVMDPRVGATTEGRGAVSGRAAGASIEHDHGLGRHTHVLPDPARPLGPRTLAAMGVAGGLVPSPSALVVLLGATALGRAWFGVLLVLAYGAGMALTLTLAGLLVLRAQGALATRWSGPGGLMGSATARGVAVLLPVLTAAVIVGVGVIIVSRGLATAAGLD